ncbi:hypothetical protein [Streptomyces sp. ISL-100]|nr:hypothetical protein [Streptomyces sp. ISL-100]MBT2401197.1 hypothetical protein [Streptomyces sp. ISL-100]
MNAARDSTLLRKAATRPAMMLTITLAAAKTLAPVSARQMALKEKAE